MKKLLLVPMLVLVGCTNPYQTARSTVMIGRGALAMAKTGFETYVQVETKKCDDQCKTDQACKDKCMAPVEKSRPIFQKATLAVSSGLDESDALINVAEKLKKKESVDWLVPLKGAACLLARSLDLTPAETKKKIQGLIDLMGSFGCP
jgi:hypothetical protein